MRVKLVDPSAFTPPYDRALAAALAAAGADVELITSRFTYGPVPEADGYRESLDFYRMATAGRAASSSALRRAIKLAEHGPNMLRLRRKLDRAPKDGEPLVTHYQWLTMPGLDRHLISNRRPRVLTAHYVLPPHPSERDLRRAARIYGSMDAVITHSRAGAERLTGEAGVPPDRVRVIPHGSFEHLTRSRVDAWLPAEFGRPDRETERGPVILFFGLLRPYKGLDLLLEACRRLTPPAGGPAPELWIAGNPRMDLNDLKARAEKLPIPVRWATRFISDAEIAPLMRQADLLVLPYRDGEQSGVLYTGIAFGKAMVVSDVGGIGEVAREHGLARLVTPGDADELGEALVALTADPAARAALEGRAAAAAGGPFSWPEIAARTLELYSELIR
ncbi:MAG: glycosyltransferase family 4 protein [Solirubrobacterales bacterium]|nr:glycosyltransferase family 4 protein [Solirubrobacterales bacterium]